MAGPVFFVEFVLFLEYTVGLKVVNYYELLCCIIVIWSLLSARIRSVDQGSNNHHSMQQPLHRVGKVDGIPDWS